MRFLRRVHRDFPGTPEPISLEEQVAAIASGLGVCLVGVAFAVHGGPWLGVAVALIGASRVGIAAYMLVLRPRLNRRVEREGRMRMEFDNWAPGDDSL